MRLPATMVELLAGQVVSDGRSGQQLDQAFPLLTIAPSGHSHVCLLSAEQLALGDDGETIFVSVAGTTTRDNLLTRGLATVVAVGTATAYYAKSTVVASTVVEGRTGFALRVSEVKADSAGVELSPLGFRFAPELAIEERWSRDHAVLDALSALRLQPVDGD